MKLFTIGYEGEPQPAVIERLKAAGVQRLIDVRAVAASRRAGFSKTVLGESLKVRGGEPLAYWPRITGSAEPVVMGW